MRPEGEAARLFDALSRTAVRAFADQRLLSCRVLDKSPDQDNILRRFLGQDPPRPGGKACIAGLLLRLAPRYLAANSLHLAFMLLTALFARLRGWRSPLAADFRRKAAPLIIIDSYAVLPRIAKDGVWRDLYLPGLAEAARARGHGALTLYRLYGSRNPLILWRALGVLARSGPGLLETHLLRPGDWPRLALHVLLYPFSLLRLIRSLAKHPPERPERFIREALIRTAGGNILSGEARRLAGLRLAEALAAALDSAGDRTLARPAQAAPEQIREEPGSAPDRLCAGPTRPPEAHIISWYENQTQNKTFLRGLRQGQKSGTVRIRCTGAQLLLWPAALLNNHADDAEAALGLAPDRVLVNGPHFLPAASGQDYAPGPSLRYAHLFARKRRKAAAEGDLLVLLSYHPEETRRVLAMARELTGQPAGQPTCQPTCQPTGQPAGSSACDSPAAFAGARGPAPGVVPYGPRLIFRFHPATRVEDYAALLPPGARLSTGPLDQALDSAWAVMGAGSGSLAEAVALGLPALAVEAPEAEGGLNYLPDQGRGFLWQALRCGQDAAAALALLRRGLHEPGRAQAVDAFRAALFTVPDPGRITRMLRGD